jgi:hypothetical protein
MAEACITPCGRNPRRPVVAFCVSAGYAIHYICFFNARPARQRPASRPSCSRPGQSLRDLGDIRQDPHAVCVLKATSEVQKKVNDFRQIDVLS